MGHFTRMLTPANQPETGPGREERSTSRFCHMGAIFLSWRDSLGKNYVLGKCVDISEGGLGVELARRISVGTEVRVRAGFVDLDTPATVRHIRDQGGAFCLGLQFQQPLHADVVAQLIAQRPS